MAVCPGVGRVQQSQQQLELDESCKSFGRRGGRAGALHLSLFTSKTAGVMLPEAPKTIERKLRSTGVPGAELLARITAVRLDELLRETKDCSVRQKKRLVDERLKALGVKKLGHRLQIQAALREAREHVTKTTPQVSAPLTADEFMFTPPHVVPSPRPRALGDLTNFDSSGPTPKRIGVAAKKIAGTAFMQETLTPAECDEPVLESNEPDEPVLEPNEPGNATMCALLLADAAPGGAPAVARRWLPGSPSTSPSLIARTTGFIASLPGRLMRLPFRAISIYPHFWLVVAGGTFTVALFLAERAVSRLPVGRSQAVALVGLVRELTKGAPEIILGA